MLKLSYHRHECEVALKGRPPTKPTKRRTPGMAFWSPWSQSCGNRLHPQLPLLNTVSGLASNRSCWTNQDVPNQTKKKQCTGTLWERSPSRPITARHIKETCFPDTEFNDMICHCTSLADRFSECNVCVPLCNCHNTEQCGAAMKGN